VDMALGCFYLIISLDGLHLISILVIVTKMKDYWTSLVARCAIANISETLRDI